MVTGHWSDTVDRWRGDTEMFGHWLDTTDRQEWGTEMPGHCFDTLDRQRGILRRLVSGWIQ